jgi:hypothetical protein
LLFAAVVFPIHVWCILGLLRELPAWILRLSTRELVAVIAYCLAFAFVESVVLFLLLILAGAFLPKRVFRDSWVAKGSMAVLVTSIWAVVAHYNDEIIRLWGAREFLLWFAIYLASLLLCLLLVSRVGIVGKALRSLVGRLAILSAVYVLIDAFGFLVVITRNVLGSS